MEEETNYYDSITPPPTPDALKQPEVLKQPDSPYGDDTGRSNTPCTLLSAEFGFEFNFEPGYETICSAAKVPNYVEDGSGNVHTVCSTAMCP